MLNNIVFYVLAAGVICGTRSGLLVSNDHRSKIKLHSLVMTRENERSDEAWAGWPEQNSNSLCRTGTACH